MVSRARLLLAAAACGIALRMAVACSTSSGSAPVAEAGPPGEQFSACQVQGYFPENDGGGCPAGTCPARAFDTNGGLLPCCTSIASGPGPCVDGSVPGSPDAAEASTDASDAGRDAADAMLEAGVPDTSSDAPEGAAATPDAAGAD